jgi:ketosteroid isomerase-like protein
VEAGKVRLRDFLLTPTAKRIYHAVRPMARRLLHNRGLWSIAGLLAVLLCAGTIFAQPQGANAPHLKKEVYKGQVEKLEESWRTAQLNGDVAAMDKLLSDDYVGITMSGQVVTKTQQLDRMQRRQMVLTKIVLSDVKVRLIGTTAIVQSRADVDGTNEGNPMHGTYRYTRVYSRLPSGVWKITNFEATRVGPPPGPPPDAGQHHSGPRPN